MSTNAHIAALHVVDSISSSKMARAWQCDKYGNDTAKGKQHRSAVEKNKENLKIHGEITKCKVNLHSPTVQRFVKRPIFF